MCDGKPGHVHEFAYKCPECLQREKRIAELEARVEVELCMRRSAYDRIAELEGDSAAAGRRIGELEVRFGL